MTNLQSLWNIADRLGRDLGKDPDYVLDPCGLLLQRPLRRAKYASTPRNSLTFANTGGDGVHFGFLEIDFPAELRPIVMTVPMASRNVVVAETFEEFLGLGYHVGWFALEQIVYDPAEAVRYFARPGRGSSSEREQLLSLLRRELGFRHVPLSTSRLNELEAKYWTSIRVDGGASQESL